MGSVKRDIHRKGREYDVDYAYNDVGVAALLKDVYRIGEQGDPDAITIMCDLKLALDSDCLTPRMRQVVALYYFVQLTEEETADILGISQPAVKYALDNALLRISNEMESGGARQGGRGNFSFNSEDSLYLWLNEIAYNSAKLYDVPETVALCALSYLAELGEGAAKEALRQRADGPPNFSFFYGDGEEYPCLTEEQFKWRDRRMSYQPVIYPAGTLIGKVTVAVRDANDGWKVEKRKIFKENISI